MKAEGATLSPRKGFYLTVMNPYDEQQKFRLDALAWASEAGETAIDILPASAVLGPGQRRRVLVIFNNLEKGEERRARVCARLDRSLEGVAIDARVCSKLIARRKS
tara:strand:- start:65861 stop:66178 length:318 start_codon:yes stop_codon:yes gene_type:complete